MLSYTSTVTSTDTATDNYNYIESTISCGMKVANFCIDIWHYYGLYTRASGFLKRKGKKKQIGITIMLKNESKIDVESSLKVNN